MQGSPLAAISICSHAGLLIHRAAALIQVRVAPEGHIHLHTAHRVNAWLPENAGPPQPKCRMRILLLGAG